jgi:hypothetical protein
MSDIHYFIAWNEARIDIVKKYILKYPKKFNSIHKLLKFNIYNTKASVSYEKLEPWIQWTSIYTGLEPSSHQIENLSDKNLINLRNIFEDRNSTLCKIGVLGMMNYYRDIKLDKSNAVFIADPWSDLESDYSLFSKLFSKFLKSVINNNTNKGFKLIDIFMIIFLIINTRSAKNICYLIFLGIKGLKKRWYRALFLDALIGFNVGKILKRDNTKIGLVFFNGLAHIQHHYFHNCEFTESRTKNPEWYIGQDQDPFYDSLIVYDRIYENILRLTDNIFICTALSQIENKDTIFYWRLKKHAEFLENLDIRFDSVQPLMSRDFYIHFSDRNEIKRAQDILKSIIVENTINGDLEKTIWNY